QDFLDQIVEMFRLQAQAKGLGFKHDRSAALPLYVRTDEKRLRQILVNLLSNAIKFTDAGMVRFDIAYRSQVATFTVSDTGRGIAAEDLPRIYEPFHRGEAENMRPMPGLGLGLTITQLLTNTLGGEITVESSRDEGSSFRVRLMLAAVSRPSTAPALERRILSYDGPRRTIVVVDDNEDHRDLMREALVPLDFIVLTAASGPECLTLIEGVKPDIFFIDISMPGMNGWQLVSRLRDAGQVAPIVMLSANIGDGTGVTVEGHDNTLAKPFDLRRLCDKLALHLGLRWTYLEDARKDHAGEPSVSRLVFPDPSHVAELIRLGEIGYVKGIEAKLAEIASQPKHERFASVLRGYVRAFDLAGYAAFLKDAAEKKEPHHD